MKNPHRIRLTSLIATLLGTPALAAEPPPYQILKQNVLINADYWSKQPKILAAGLGFSDILGIPGLDVSDEGKAKALAAGAAWEILSTTLSDPPLRAYTSAASTNVIAMGYGVPVVHGGGMPIEFSWPVLPSTLDPTDFKVVMNTGEKVTPEAASISPNLEYNERSTVVLIGQLGNRIQPGLPGSRYPVKLKIVKDDTPLTLVGPGGKMRSAVGLSYGNGRKPLTGYYAGPTLCAAKLSRLTNEGEGGPAIFAGGYTPNDGVSLYGGGPNQYRLRVLTTGGFSPDGVRSLYPTEYASFFRIRVKDKGGKVTWLTETNKTYTFKTGTITVLGLADLSVGQSSYDDGYVEDHDNQIDIILEGDEKAMRRITHIEAPSSNGYGPFYNPGGPGNDPVPGETYSEPSTSIRQSVKMAIDDPMTVTLIAPTRK